MGNKPLDQEDNKPFDYFSDEKAAQKQEAPNTEKLVSTLRSDMLPASRVLPARKNIFQRINFKLVLGILLGLVIIWLVWYALAGPGRPLLQQRLESLMQRSIVSTQQAKPSPLPTTGIVAVASKIPMRTATLIPTPTQELVSIATPTPSPPSPTPTNSSQCREVLSITLADVGQTLCVQGTVIKTKANPTDFMVVFSNEKGAFYWVTYDLVWSQGELDTCYRIKGTIGKIANSPVLVFGYSNLPELCP